MKSWAFYCIKHKDFGNYIQAKTDDGQVRRFGDILAPLSGEAG